MHNSFLIGKRVYLRPLEISDLTEKYQQWFNDAEVCAFNSHHRFPNYRQNMEEYYESVIKNRTNLVLAIIDRDSNTHIGNIALQDIDSLNRSSEFAIIIGDKNFWGKSIGQEAGELIVEHGFQSLNLHRIYCGTSVANEAMQKLAKRLGFKEEGRSREALFKNGSYQDIILYGLLKTDYENKD